MITDGPIIIPNFPTGYYTVDVIVVDSIYMHITTTEMIVLRNNITSNMSTDEPATTATCTGKQIIVASNCN